MKKLGKLAKRVTAALAVATFVATAMPATAMVYAAPPGNTNVMTVKAPPAGQRPQRGSDDRATRRPNQQRPNEQRPNPGRNNVNHPGEHKPPRRDEARPDHRPPNHGHHHGPRKGHRPPAPPPRPHNHWHNRAYAIAVAKHDGYMDGYEGYGYGTHKKYWRHSSIRAVYDYYYDVYYRIGWEERQGFYY